MREGHGCQWQIQIFLKICNSGQISDIHGPLKLPPLYAQNNWDNFIQSAVVLMLSTNPFLGNFSSLLPTSFPDKEMSHLYYLMLPTWLYSFVSTIALSTGSLHWPMLRYLWLESNKISKQATNCSLCLSLMFLLLLFYFSPSIRDNLLNHALSIHYAPGIEPGFRDTKNYYNTWLLLRVPNICRSKMKYLRKIVQWWPKKGMVPFPACILYFAVCSVLWASIPSSYLAIVPVASGKCTF